MDQQKQQASRTPKSPRYSADSTLLNHAFLSSTMPHQLALNA